ncbi:MAG: hypothetical protein CMO01_04730 [Thalassobius sp.]|nr:hypothetical protein [Thalassovita sp.]
MTQLPPYTTSVSEESFAGKTMRVRVPDILQTVFDKNDFDESTIQKLKQLEKSIPFEKIEAFEFFNEEDEKYWKPVLEKYKDNTWLELPFYVAEALFYRKILEATNWHENKKDPYEKHKSESVEKSHFLIEKTLSFTDSILKEEYAAHQLEELLLVDLWGNQADLCLFHDGNTPNNNEDEAREKLVANDSASFLKIIDKGCKRVDFIIDNTGTELIGDICLAIYMLEKKKVDNIIFHVKEAPIFVSDTLVKDVYLQLEEIEKSHPDYKHLAKIFRDKIDSGDVKLIPDLFWSTALAFNELPAHIKESLQNADLIISKGDANYRRFLQDREWDFSTPLSEVIYFFDKPVLLLRTLKSEVLAGTKPENIEKAKAVDSEWLVNGKFGVIQLHNFQ